MKRKSDPRHQKRIKIIQDLFQWDFRRQKVNTAVARIIENLPTIDSMISASAPERPISEINRIDLAILRLSVFELIIEKDAPFKVIVDEAVELGKEYGSSSSPGFINGVLGKIIAGQKLDQE